MSTKIFDAWRINSTDIGELVDYSSFSVGLYKENE